MDHSVPDRPELSVFAGGAGGEDCLDSFIFRAAIKPAPRRTPPARPAMPVAVGLITPCGEVTGAYVAGGVGRTISAGFNMATRNVTSFSVQPKQGCPSPMGQASHTSQKCRTEHLACVEGPLHPSLYKQ